METDYSEIASEYKVAKQQPWRKHIELFTIFSLLGDLKKRDVIDIACGEGFLTRSLKKAGASRVLGVDVSKSMIALAQEEENNHPLGIEYLVQDAKLIDLREKFDLASAGYLLNYAQNRDQLRQMCESIVRCLRPGGRFITVNNNPSHLPEFFRSTEKYGFVKRLTGELKDGAPVDYEIQMPDGSTIDIRNYHLSTETHESVFREVGFQEIQWHAPKVDPKGIEDLGSDFWMEFINHPPVIFIECSLSKK